MAPCHGWRGLRRGQRLIDRGTAFRAEGGVVVNLRLTIGAERDQRLATTSTEGITSLVRCVATGTALQEIDHVPFVSPLVKFAATAGATAEIPELLRPGDERGGHAPLGARLPRLPARPRVHGGRRARRRPSRCPSRGAARAAAAELDRAAALLRDAERPVIMAGTGLYWGRGEEQLQALAEELRVPCSSTASAAAACPPTTSCPSPVRAAPDSARPTWRW